MIPLDGALCNEADLMCVSEDQAPFHPKRVVQGIAGLKTEDRKNASQLIWNY